MNFKSLQKQILVTAAASLFCFSNLQALDVTYEYSDKGQTFEGYKAYPEEEGKRPAVILIHEWDGLGDYVKGRAKQIAGLGYVAFAADIYGKGVRAKTPEEAGKLAGLYKNDRHLMRARVKLAYDLIKKDPRVDPKKIAIMGYCFGGTVALELARSGADLVGVATFHGGLSTPLPAKPKMIKAKILVLHGAADPYVPATEVADFQKEMNDAGADWQFISYSNAVHAFTNPKTAYKKGAGAGYNKEADFRSWEHMKVFFQEIFAKDSK